MNQKGSAGIIAAIIFIVIVLVILIIPKGKTTYETTYNPLASLLPSPSPQKTSYHGIDSIEDAIKYPEEARKLEFCNQLTEVSPKVGELTKTEYLDLSNNNLTTLPDEISKLKNSSLRELALVDNNFSFEEQVKIRKLLPYTKIAFAPQKKFDPYFKDSWESYDSKKFGFSFRYHPELLIQETDNGLFIENEFAQMNTNAFSSCAIETSFIKMKITVEDNPENLTPIQYIEKNWQIKTRLQGEEYVVDDKQVREQKMFGYVKKYKIGDIDGLISDGGESEHPGVTAVHNGKIYQFVYLPGGETGSRIAPIAKRVLEQTLATFKFIN